MEAKIKFGCLKGAEAVRTPFHVGGANIKRWTETYETTWFKLALPEQGVEQTPMACPMCAQAVTIKLASPATVYSITQYALLLWTLVSVGLGALLFFVEQPRSTAFTIAAGVCGLFAVASFLVALAPQTLPAGWFKSSLVSISNDEVRNQPQEPGYAGMRGHKLIEVNLK